MSVRKIKDIKFSCFAEPSKHKEIELFCGFIKKRYSSFHHIRIFETKQLPKLQYSSLFQVILTRFLKNGDIFLFNNNKAIAKITFKDDL